VKFKIDENLPVEAAAILVSAGFAADTIDDEGLSGAEDSVVITRTRFENRILVTLDLDFASIQAYPAGTRRNRYLAAEAPGQSNCALIR
jgi:predicted nuclease of predicted toxin-antitoxin system